MLELGIGGGVHSSRVILERHRLTGVDVSQAQLRRARARLPGATLLHADMTAVGFASNSFDAVVAFYTLTHLPRDEIGPLLTRVAAWLRSCGWFLATFGAGDNPGSVADDWIGTPMFFSGFDRERNLELLEAAGFRVEREEVVAQDEPGRRELAHFHWVLARTRA